MPLPSNRRKLFFGLVVLAGVAILLVACGKKPEEPTSPALDAETQSKPAQPAQVAPEQASHPPPPLPAEAKAGLAQADTPLVSPEPPVDPRTQTEDHRDVPDTRSVDPRRLEELELKLTTQQEALDRMQNALSEQQERFEALQTQFTQFKEQVGTASRPVVKIRRFSPGAHLRRRRESRTPSSPPFSVESVDRWGDEQRIVVRADRRRFDLKLGESYGDWTIESAEGQKVTLSHRKGHRQVVDAAWR